jgi:hypothetical protein
MEINQTPEAVALTAACRLHSELLNDDGFFGYDGTKHQFDLLFQELFVIARDEVSLEIDPIDQVVETWYEYQMEIVAGERDCCWW